MWRKNIVGILVLVSLLSCAGWAQADSVRLAWNANTVDTDLASVQVYRAVGACATHGPFLPITTFPPLAVTGYVFVSALGPSCFAISYRDRSGNESRLSNLAETTITCPYGGRRCRCLAHGGVWDTTLKTCRLV